MIIQLKRRIGLGVSTVILTTQMSGISVIAAQDTDFIDILEDEFEDEKENMDICESVENEEFSVEYLDEEIYKGDISGSGQCKNNFVWELSSDGTLTINGSGKFEGGFTVINGSFNKSAVKKIVIGEGITDINDNQFSEYKNLITVQLPNTLKSIGNNAFEGCISLETINLPNSIMEIGSCAFKECSSLESVTLPLNLTVIDEEVFRKCTNLKNVIIPEGTTIIKQQAFDNCISIKTINLPNTINTIECNAFFNCTSLEKIVIPKGMNTISRTSFEMCRGLREVEIPHSITKIEWGAFWEDYAIESVYYHGTDEDWEKIDIEDFNKLLLKAEINYLSSDEPEPTNPTVPITPTPAPTSDNATFIYNEETKAYDYVVDGEVDYNMYGFVDYEGYKFIVANGCVAPCNGLVMDPNSDKWYFCAEGQVVKHTGLVMYNEEWFYVNDGVLDTNLNALVPYNGGLFYVAAGRLTREVSGLVLDPNSPNWYFVALGEVQNNYTGLVQYNGEWFYVKEGRLASEYTGTAWYNGTSFNVINGMVK